MQPVIFKSIALAISLNIAGAFSVAAQQMAANTTAQFAACDQIKDPAKSAQCSADVSLNHAKQQLTAAQARLAQAEVGSTSADALLRCAEFLKGKKAAGMVLDPTRLNRDQGCAYAAELGLK